MSRSARPMRGRKASRRVDTGAIEAMVRDGRIWSTLGKVMKPDSANEHWQIKDGKILIEVETLPDSMDLTCRLGTSGFGGWWRSLGHPARGQYCGSGGAGR